MSERAQTQVKQSSPISFTRISHGALQRQCACGNHTMGSECKSCDKKSLSLQRKIQDSGLSPQHSDAVPRIVHNVLRSPGQPLDATNRAYFESRFGHDFSGVRVHADAKAAESARAVNALAYTVGRDVVFGEGQYVPASASGRRLLIHELSHVLQQGARSAPSTNLRVDNSESALEYEADKITETIVQRNDSPAKIERAPAVRLARQEATRRPSIGSGTQPAPGVLQELPVVFVAEPLDVPGTTTRTEASGERAGVSPSGYTISGGLSLHVLASGDMSWLSPQAGAQRVLGGQYWSPLLPSRGAITLDRLLDELPRDLAPRIEAELASGQPLSWVRGAGATGTTFTEAELRSIPTLARRLNTGEVLSQAEISLLARATEIHVGGSTPGAPFASYTQPNFEISFPRRYRVRVEIPRSNVLDVSQPNVITNLWSQSHNADEMEFMAVANHEGRITSVQRITGSTRPSTLMRYSGAIRWGGRILIVAGVAVSAYRIATAPEGERLNVAAEEGGGMAGGALGTSLAVAGCLAFGVASGGIGLFLCGLAGGVIGGTVGSGVAGGMMHGLQGGSTPCPSCHALQREWEARRSFNSLRDVQFGTSGSDSGERLSASGRAPGTRALAPTELELIRRWLQDSGRQQGNQPRNP